MGRLERNSAAIRRYLTEVLPKLEKSTVAPDEPPDRKHRGGSRSPWGRGGDEIVEANRAASLVLTPLIAQMRASGAGWKGVSFSEVLLAVGNHPGVTQTWREHSKTLEAALWQMCLLVARAAHVRWDAAEIRIGGEVLKRAGEPLELDRLVVVGPGDREAHSHVQAAAQDREEARRAGMAESHHIRYEQLRELEEQGYSREAAKARWSEEHDMSVPTIRDSIRFVEKGEWPDGTPVTQELRWEGLRYRYEPDDEDGDAA
jgi:hypothetical protein